ncbi:ABC transporter ATP-binding protein [Embleya sp. NPDC050493]|uniref:ABC transporter ATP-binding protein n=1 Tax=Embleya sp. NPDC050493 TaxID=3363989 RepID=UPI00379A67DC
MSAPETTTRPIAAPTHPLDAGEGLRADGIRVVDAAGRPVLDGFTAHAPAGGVLALVGPSGCGKTTALRALLGPLPVGLRSTAGTVTWHGAPRPTAHAGRAWRLRHVGLLGQDPHGALDPRRTILDLVAEAAADRGVARRAAREQALELLDRLGLDAGLAAQRPPALSGGQAQRAALAVALVADPVLVFLDEPTASLDRETAGRVTNLIRERHHDRSRVTVTATHDPYLIAELADRVLRFDRPGIRRSVPRRERALIGPPILAAHAVELAGADRAVTPSAGGGPEAGAASFTTAASIGSKLQSVREPEPEPEPGPGLGPGPESDSGTDPAPARREFAAPLLRGVELSLHAGEFVALIGPSGSGKSTLLRALAGLHPPRAGTLHLGTDLGPLAASAAARSRAELRRIQYVGQDPRDELNPAHRVIGAVARPLRGPDGLARTPARHEALRLLAAVGLDAETARRRPGRLSGGQRQRVALARALAARPQILLADEVTSALDADTAAALLDLLDGLRAEGLAVLMATHDPHIAARADRVLHITGGALTEGTPAPDHRAPGLRHPGHPDPGRPDRSDRSEGST